MASMRTRHQSSTYHLTRNGWIVGDLPPADRIESWHCVIEAAGRSKRYVEWTCLWADPQIPEEERDRLRRRFSEPVRVFATGSPGAKPAALATDAMQR
jgi:hypothetical protein